MGNMMGVWRLCPSMVQRQSIWSGIPGKLDIRARSHETIIQTLKTEISGFPKFGVKFRASKGA